MSKSNFLSRATLGTAIAAVLAASIAATASAPALAQPTAVRPSTDVSLSIGTGRMVRMDAPITDIFVANSHRGRPGALGQPDLHFASRPARPPSSPPTGQANGLFAIVRVETYRFIDRLLRVAMTDPDEARPSTLVMLTGRSPAGRRRGGQPPVPAFAAPARR